MIMTQTSRTFTEAVSHFVQTNPVTAFVQRVVPEFVGTHVPDRRAEFYKRNTLADTGKFLRHE